MTAPQGWDDLLDPFTFLGNAAAKVATDAWTASMLALWNAGLWLLRLVLGWVDTFLTPDLRETGPMGGTYRITFWVAATLLIALALVQTGIAAARRDGRSIARVLVGGAQFVMVWAAWITYAIALLYACSGLTKAVMKATMGVDTWAQWNPWGTVEAEDLTDATIATVLGVLGCLVIIAAIGHLMVMLARAAALIVLVATAPIAAAGLASEVGQSWFWKSVRWTHAAALTPPLMALVIGAGTQTTTATVTGTGDAGLASAVGTAVPAVMLILISCFAPLALFKLLAFVDPGTTSGAAMRNGLAAAGGVQGLLSSGSSSPAGMTAASSTDAAGRAAPESTGEDATTSRFAQTASGMLGAAGRVLGTAAGIGATGAAVSADMTNQMGVGHHSYIPDFTRPPRPGTSRPGAPDTRGEDQSGADTPDLATPDQVAPVRPLPTPAAASGSGAGGGAGAAGAGAGAAASVPVVPA